MWTSSASSAAAMITNPGRQPRYGRSKAPAWVGPSAPTRPARSSAKRTGSRWTGREGDAMLLGDPDVEGARRKLLGEDIDAGARRHCRGDRDDAVVLPG